MPNRPKQRHLVRWNGKLKTFVRRAQLTSIDDLDKSLLLFISHTCTEMGIKIPCEWFCGFRRELLLSPTDDEVARRMGSAFSEGAIQQHIAKLRNQMAELNVAPVPGPPRRGNVTKRPSSIYTQKTRAGPPPPPPPPASKARARTMNQVDDEGQGSTGKAKPKRRATGRNIKRSASDVAASDDEFAGADSDDFNPQQTAGGRKRKQSGASRGRANTSRRVSNSHAADISTTNSIMRTLSDADAQFEAQQAMNGGQHLPGQEHMFGIQNSIEGNGQAGNNFVPQQTYGGYAGFMANAAEGEEEEEEEDDLPMLARNQLLQARQGNAAAPLQYSQEEQISPTSQVSTSSSCLQYQSRLTSSANATAAVQHTRPRPIRLPWLRAARKCPPWLSSQS